MSVWVLVVVVMATSLTSFPLEKAAKPTDQAIGMMMVTNTYAPNVTTIDFNDQALCEAAAQKLKDDSHFGTQSALCLKRN